MNRTKMSRSTTQNISTDSTGAHASTRDVARELTRILSHGGKSRLIMIIREGEDAAPAKPRRAADPASVGVAAAPKKVRAARAPAVGDAAPKKVAAPAADAAAKKARARVADGAATKKPRAAAAPAAAAAPRARKAGASTSVGVLKEAVKSMYRTAQKRDEAGAPTKDAQSASSALNQLNDMFANGGSLPDGQSALEHRLKFPRKTNGVEARFCNPETTVLSKDCMQALRELSADTQ